VSKHRFLVAYDGSENAFHALRMAAERARDDGAEVDVVTVLRPETQAAAEAAAYLAEQGLEPMTHTPVGDPASEILRVVEEGGYDTVYLGTRGGGSLTRALEGSVSSTVAGSAPVTVVIAR
jgi:nucleotide-binding universal stress UspA family protein